MLSTSVHDLLEKNVQAGGEALALIDKEARVTYGELDRRVAALAAWLAASGVRRGDRVCIHLFKSTDEVVATFAVARLGAVFVNVNQQRTVDQLYYSVLDSGSRVVLVDARRAQEMAKHGVPDAIERVLVRGAAPDHPKMVAWSGVAPDGQAPVTKVLDVDVAAILYTSGSTGKPKGVVLTHANIVQGARSVARYLENHAGDRVLSVLPFSFDYGMNQLMTMCLVGGSLVLQGVSVASEVIKTAAAHACTGLAAVPPLWIPLVRTLESKRTPLPALRYVTNSGGAIPPGILRAMPEVFPGTKIFLMYGLTEAFRSTFVPPDRFQDKMGSIGKAIPNAEVFVITDKGIAGADEEGELVHRGALVSLGYWNQPEATAEKIRPCPALRHLIGDEKVCYSGDRVRVDADGFLWFVGRTDSMIKCSGHRLSPTEVEDVAYESRQVGDCVAFGVDHETLGEVVHLAVGGLQGASIDVDAFMDFCRDKMPTYMVPAKVHVWPGEMPRNANGKLDRPAIIAACKER
jgi:acyl-CoA ligase (AMP-forming) (exosortase A-associated)